MIIWLASYPRSGNTFFRILLRHLYGLQTYTGFLSGDDLSLVGAGDLTGHAKLPPDLESALRLGDGGAATLFQEAEQLYFIKSHLMAQETALAGLPTVLLVRDVRDVLVSYAWYLIKIQTEYARAQPLVELIRERDSESLRVKVTGLLHRLGFTEWLFQVHLKSLVGLRRWSDLNDGWMDRPQGGPLRVVHFQDLIERPLETMRNTLRDLLIDLPLQEERFPDFQALQRVYPAFFRDGKVGAGRQCYSDALHEKLWRVHGTTMNRFGYLQEGPKVDGGATPSSH